MDDAVGFLVGPELVRPGASSATAVATAAAETAAAAAAAAPPARPAPTVGSDGSRVAAGSDGRGKEVDPGILRAEEVSGSTAVKFWGKAKAVDFVG